VLQRQWLEQRTGTDRAAPASASILSIVDAAREGPPQAGAATAAR